MIELGDRFTWQGVELDYLVDDYNTTALNERAFEVPVARHFLAGREGRGLEVGNVLGHYGPADHRVVDLYEVAPNVENVDVLEVRGIFDWIVTISTLEHVGCGPSGHDPLDPAAAIHAVEHLLHMLAPGGAMLATVPFGQNPYLDGAILAGGLDATLETTMLFGDDRWTALEGARLWRPLRERSWPISVWVGEWRR